mgnify:CR=1 FL=1
MEDIYLFVIYFCVSIVAMVFLLDLINNIFTISLILSLVFAYLAVRGRQNV